mmetsp:Transcript_3727/g.8756  ORF Transcript_3727/g.8756 Transcript_3727/m.8756 type:complete len:120 (-) Transcript_3727:1836-2195(-)
MTSKSRNTRRLAMMKVNKKAALAQSVTKAAPTTGKNFGMEDITEAARVNWAPMTEAELNHLVDNLTNDCRDNLHPPSLPTCSITQSKLDSSGVTDVTVNVETEIQADILGTVDLNVNLD